MIQFNQWYLDGMAEGEEDIACDERERASRCHWCDDTMTKGVCEYSPTGKHQVRD